jgi:hypothetical protein
MVLHDTLMPEDMCTCRRTYIYHMVSHMQSFYYILASLYLLLRMHDLLSDAVDNILRYIPLMCTTL